MKNLIDKYNNPETVLMVSLYPKKGELYSAATSGVASYAKNLVSHLNHRVAILTNYKGRRETYEEKEVLVMRCFKTNTFFQWIDLAKKVFRFDKAQKLLIQFDFSMYGNVLPSSLIIPFLLFCRIRKMKPYLILHHVITDVFKISGHVGLTNRPQDKLKGHIYNIIFRMFYILLGIFSEKIVVLEEPLRKRLNKFVTERKIVTVPHGVDERVAPIAKQYARKRLGINQKELVILFFGFLNWFKGSDLIVPIFGKKTRFMKKNMKYVIAGGKSPTMRQKHFYQEYFSKVIKTIADNPTVKITGYVPQKNIAKYFSAADLVVFPYRSFMTASGVLSLVFSFQKPFIVSDQIEEMLDSSDFSYALKQSGLNKEDLTFSLNKYSAVKCTEKVLKDGLKKKMITMTKIMREIRSYENTAKLYENLLFNPTFTWNVKLQTLHV